MLDLVDWTVPPDWPSLPYSHADWPQTWLRFETEYPGSGRPSRLVAHEGVPFVATFLETEQPTTAQLGFVAWTYLRALARVLSQSGRGLNVSILEQEDQNADDFLNAFHWLPIWPQFGEVPSGLQGKLASWNLSQNPDHALPASVIMVAAESYQEIDPDVAPQFISLRSGLRVPMLVERDNGIVRVTIRSMTAEFPAEGHRFLTEILQESAAFNPRELRAFVNETVQSLTQAYEIKAKIAQMANVSPDSVTTEDIQFALPPGATWSESPWVFTLTSKGQDSQKDRFPTPLSREIISRFKMDDFEAEPRLIAQTTCPLVTHASPPGSARVFKQTPPSWAASLADLPYSWSERRPSRKDSILNRFRNPFQLGAQESIELKGSGFVIRPCPDYVPGDHGLSKSAGTAKLVNLPLGKDLPPRRDKFSAISAYYNSVQFFGLMQAFGLDPGTYVVQAQPDCQIKYRYGITPGPGKSGRTINAQVAFDCGQPGKPYINMHLALANLSRLDRPDTSPPWAQPLGIATSGRWMAHEFGHYLLAARLGQLEFSFAHSAGDAMAAVLFDPDSILADPTVPGVHEDLRGITYPFVFSTRRHDRLAALGWAWYGALNRSMVAHPDPSCASSKGYLTEQILSTSIFRLYRSLGGDSLADDKPDLYLRKRAALVTLFLLLRAIAGFAQSPSKAEMLELGQEEASWLIPPPTPATRSPTSPNPATWPSLAAQKVVRWAYEAQGMFPPDEEVVWNAPGQAPPVDVYLRDQRPQAQSSTAGPIDYGPGSYAPVSLSWEGTPLWSMDPANLKVGNRGTEVASMIKLRAWLGFTPPAIGNGRWDLGAQISWSSAISLDDDFSLQPGEELDLLTNPTLVSTLGDMRSQLPMMGLFLIEASCPNDRANTDPLASFATAVADNGSGLPQTPRTLADLVAMDNNLGLVIARV